MAILHVAIAAQHPRAAPRRFATWLIAARPTGTPPDGCARSSQPRTAAARGRMFAWANSRVANGRREVPSLIQLSLAALAANSEMIDDLRCTDEPLCTALLRLVMGAGRLDFRLACVFRDAGARRLSPREPPCLDSQSATIRVRTVRACCAQGMRASATPLRGSTCSTRCRRTT